MSDVTPFPTKGDNFKTLDEVEHAIDSVIAAARLTAGAHFPGGGKTAVVLLLRRAAEKLEGQS